VAVARDAHRARARLFDPADTDCWLWIDRHHDGFDGVRVERLGDVALAVDHGDRDELPASWLDAWSAAGGVEAIYHRPRPRPGAGAGARTARLVRGTDLSRFVVHEHGVRYQIDLDASPTSSGLFLDQRDTRRRLLDSDLAGATVLNVFAHTGSLSVAAALAGAETLTLDLSRRYLDWARENLVLNDIDAGDHDFVYGDALEWMDRFARKGRTFDVVLVDPPITSTTRKGRRWAVDRDLHDLVGKAAGLAATGGTVFVSTNLRRLGWGRFRRQVERGLAEAGRTAEIETATLPSDHRWTADDPAYLKVAWIALDR
jgi:23S rRNA (cytosine1962-C5)-methyltransferase